MLKRIALVMCVVTVFSGCGGEEGSAAKKTKPKNGNGAKNPPKGQNGNIENDGADGDGGAGNGAGKTKLPSAPPAAVKKLSFVEQMQGIQDDCLKKLEPVLGRMSEGIVYEKQNEIILTFHHCVIKMGELDMDLNSASFPVLVYETLLNQMSESMNILAAQNGGEIKDLKYIEQLHIIGKQFLALDKETAVKEAMEKKLEEEDIKKGLTKIFQLSIAPPAFGILYFTNLVLKDDLQTTLSQHFPEMSNILSIRNRFQIIFLFLRDLNTLLIRQKNRLKFLTVKQVKKTVSEIEQNGKSTAKFFTELTRSRFIELFILHFRELDEYNPGDYSSIDKDVEKIETDFYAKLFEAYISSSNLSKADVKTELEKVVKEGENKLENIDAGNDEEKKKRVDAVKALFNAASNTLLTELAS